MLVPLSISPSLGLDQWILGQQIPPASAKQQPWVPRTGLRLGFPTETILGLTLVTATHSVLCLRKLWTNPASGNERVLPTSGRKKAWCCVSKANSLFSACSEKLLNKTGMGLAGNGWCAFTMKKILASRDDYRPSGNQHVTQLLLQNYLLTCVITTGCRTFFPSSRCPLPSLCCHLPACT